MAVSKKIGRPTIYSEELASDFCSRIALGNSLRRVCAQADMPDPKTIYTWFKKHDGFLQQYVTCKADSADSRADQVEEIAEKVLEGEYDPAAARVAIDAFKWTSGKHKPKKYGDRIQQDNISSDGSMAVDGLTAEQRKNRIDELLNKSKS